MSHLSDEQIRRYRERSASDPELLEVSEHIGGCEACRTRLASPDELAAGARAFRSAIRAEAGPVHVSYDALEGYVDGTMSSGDRLELEAHVRDCASCESDLDGIWAVRRELDVPREAL